jgi:hypothetical protein
VYHSGFGRANRCSGALAGSYLLGGYIKSDSTSDGGIDDRVDFGGEDRSLRHGAQERRPIGRDGERCR